MCVRVLLHQPCTAAESRGVLRERASLGAAAERQKILTISSVALKSCGPWAVCDQL